MVYFLITISVALLSWGGYVLWKKVLRRRFLESLRYTLFLVRLPQSTQEGKEIRQEINISEQFLATLLAFQKPCVLEVAVPHIGEEIHFFIAVQARFGNALVRQVHAIWSDADIHPVNEYNIFNYSGATSAAYVRLRERFILPIRTYQEANVDTFMPLLGGLAKIDEIGEGGVLQYVFRPARVSQLKSIRSALKVLHKGWKLHDVLKNTLALSFSDFTNTFSKGVGKKDSENINIDETGVKVLEMKNSKPLFEINMRVLASAPSVIQADSIVESITAGLSQFTTSDRNELQVVKAKNPKKLAYEFSFREFNNEESMVLTSEEFASIFHFPTAFTAIPRIKQLKSREAAPPTDIPTDGIILGESKYRGEARPIRIAREDRRRHVYVIGQTGTGKSVFLNNLSGQDVAQGEGVCVIDPNGDLVRDVLSRVPKNRLEDVILFDPSDLERPMGLNMLEYDPAHPEQKTFIVNELLNIFNTLYDLKQTGGPMFEQYVRYALLLLMEDPAEQATLMDVPRIFSDVPFRKRLLGKCNDLLTKNFWEKEAEKAGGEASLANITPYITSKFNTFIANDYVRPIIAQPKSALHFREIIDSGKILLVNLSKGRIGEINAGLLGMIIIGKLAMAAFSRDDIADVNARRDFYIYIDEFQNFVTPSIATILSEARKYRLNLTVAHQFIGQLPDNIKNAVFGNVGSMVSFRVGADDAVFLVKQFAPIFTEQDLVNIDNLNAYAKLMMHGQVTKPFTMFIPFPSKGSSDVIALGRELSRLKYGRLRVEIEDEIRERLKA